MEVASFTFEELQVNLLGDGSLIGMFEGEAHIDAQGAIIEIDFYSYAKGKAVSNVVKVPMHWRNDLNQSESFIREAANQLQADYDTHIKEVLNEWRISLRERDYEAA